MRKKIGINLITEPSISAELICLPKLCETTKSQQIARSDQFRDHRKFDFICEGLLKVTHSRDGFNPQGMPVASEHAIEENCLVTR